MRWKWHFNSVVFLLKTYNPSLVMKNTSDKFQQGASYNIPDYTTQGRRQWHPTPVLLPGKSHGRRSWWAAVHGVAEGRTWLRDFTFTFHSHALEREMATHSSGVFCLENPRDGGAWWAAIYGVAQSWTWLKWLSLYYSKWLRSLKISRVWENITTKKNLTKHDG